MNYEQKYKDALERARQFSEHPLCEDSSNIVEYIFPELVESEDERIRKEIIDFIIGDINGKNEKCKSWIAWLEKQAPKPKWTEEDEGMMNHCIGAIHIAGKQVCNSYTAKDKEQMNKWLESLKQRMGV